MILASLRFCEDYWNQHLSPASTGTFVREIDVLICQMVQKSTGVDFENASDIVKERLRLPFCQSGLGFRESEDRRYLQYLGAITESVPQLIDRTGGNNNATARGRLSMPALKERLGEGSFDSSNDKPWQIWLLNNDDKLAAGLRDTWNHINKSIQASSVPSENVNLAELLIGQPIEQAGQLPD